MRYEREGGESEALRAGAKPGGTGTGTRRLRRWMASTLKGEIADERRMGTGRCDAMTTERARRGAVKVEERWGIASASANTPRIRDRWAVFHRSSRLKSHTHPHNHLFRSIK